MQIDKIPRNMKRAFNFPLSYFQSQVLRKEKRNNFPIIELIPTETWISRKWMTTQILCGSPNDGQHLEYRYNTVNNKDFQNDT